jgi:hypothetical protein
MPPPEGPSRKQTIGYSPEESANVRAQLLAAQAALASNGQALAAPRSPQELFAAKPAILVTLGSRDEEPSSNSPLTYRERSYFGPPSAKRAEIENALRDELDTLRRALAGRPRGQYVNLAVFDHAFHERPDRPPVATLQWKDWRGEPTLAWAGSAETAQWRASPAQEPVTASFFPDSPAMSSSVSPAAEFPYPGTVAASSQGVPPKAQPIDPFPVPAASAQQRVPAAPQQHLPATSQQRVPAAPQQHLPATSQQRIAAPQQQVAAAPQQQLAAAPQQQLAAAPQQQLAAAPQQSPAAPQPQIAAVPNPQVPAAPLPQAATAGPHPSAHAPAQRQPAAPFFASPTPHGVRDRTGEQDKRLAIAFEASQDLYFLATPAEGLDFGVKLLHELVPCEAISGCIYDINTDEFRFVAVSGIGAEARRADAVRSTAGLFSAAVRPGLDSLIIRDVAAEPRYDPVTDGRTGLEPRDMAFFPLQKADHLLGMLQLINRLDPRGFGEGDLAVTSYVAHQLTEFLRSKRGLSSSRG